MSYTQSDNYTKDINVKFNSSFGWSAFFLSEIAIDATHLGVTRIRGRATSPLYILLRPEWLASAPVFHFFICYQIRKVSINL